MKRKIMSSRRSALPAKLIGPVDLRTSTRRWSLSLKCEIHLLWSIEIPGWKSMENEKGKIDGLIPVSSGSAWNCLMSFPPGFRFKPLDEHCIYYLKNKVAGAIIFPGRIHEVDIYKQPPEELDKRYRFEGEKETYFFSPRNRKYPNGSRPDRGVTGFGYWKPTGKDAPIGNGIGFKKTLVFFRGQAKDKNQSTKTNWIMQEFTMEEKPNAAPTKSKNKLASSSAPRPDMKLNDWVLCKIYENTRTLKLDARRSQDAEVVTVPVNNEEVQSPIVQSQIMANQHSQSKSPMMMPIAAVNPAMPGYLTSGHGFPALPLPNSVAHLAPQGGSVYSFPLLAPMEDGSMPLMPHMSSLSIQPMQSGSMLPPTQLQPMESGSMLPVPQPMGNGAMLQMQSMESDYMLSNHNNQEPLQFNFPCNNGQQDYHLSTSQFSLDPSLPNNHYFLDPFLPFLDSSLPDDHFSLGPFLPNDSFSLDPFLPNDNFCLDPSLPEHHWSRFM